MKRIKFLLLFIVSIFFSCSELYTYVDEEGKTVTIDPTISTSVNYVMASTRSGKKIQIKYQVVDQGRINREGWGNWYTIRFTNDTEYRLSGSVKSKGCSESYFKSLEISAYTYQDVTIYTGNDIPTGWAPLLHE